MRTEILDRIEQRLRECELNASQACLRAGLHRDVIRNMRRTAAARENLSDGPVGISSRSIFALAKVLETTPGWLMTGVEDGPTSGGGGAGAGAGLLPFIEWHEAGAYAAPGTPLKTDTTLGEHAWPRDTFVTRVLDDSMNRLAPAGAYIVVDRTVRLVSPGLCYLGVIDGQVVFRRWFSNPERIEPFSLNAVFQTEYLGPVRRWEVIGRVRRIFLDI